MATLATLFALLPLSLTPAPSQGEAPVFVRPAHAIHLEMRVAEEDVRPSLVGALAAVVVPAQAFVEQFKPLAMVAEDRLGITDIEQDGAFVLDDRLLEIALGQQAIADLVVALGDQLGLEAGKCPIAGDLGIKQGFLEALAQLVAVREIVCRRESRLETTAAHQDVAQLGEVVFLETGENIGQRAAVAESTIDQHRIAETSSDLESLLKISQGCAQLPGLKCLLALIAQILEGSHGRIGRITALVV